MIEGKENVCADPFKDKFYLSLILLRQRFVEIEVLFARLINRRLQKSVLRFYLLKDAEGDLL